jgi:hypothetical protein
MVESLSETVNRSWINLGAIYFLTLNYATKPFYCVFRVP